MHYDMYSIFCPHERPDGDFQMKYCILERIPERTKYNSGSKARNDINAILTESGVRPLNAVFRRTYPEHCPLPVKIRKHFEYADVWRKTLGKLKRGDEVFIQYPVSHGTFFLAGLLKQTGRRGVKCTAVVHDLEILRKFLNMTRNPVMRKIRFFMSGRELRAYAGMTAHNEVMKNYMTEQLHIPADRISNLQIFDYLTVDSVVKPAEAVFSDPPRIIIAGNLSREKAGYVYCLPETPLFVLYGAGYDGPAADNIDYQGTYLPDELPAHLDGMFGLVWDGPSCDTCTGIPGNYMRYNNPHKVSLYLASGIPVIIWDKAAMASFIREHECGILISSLNEAGASVGKLDRTAYTKLKQNAEQTGRLLRRGYYTRKALHLNHGQLSDTASD